MERPKLTVNGEEKKIFSISWHEGGSLARLSYFDGDSVEVIFKNPFSEGFHDAADNPVEVTL